jgi:hypothetical protein
MATVISAIVGIEGRGEFASALRDEELATPFTDEFVKLGKTLSGTDIKRIRANNEHIIAKLEVAKSFEIRWLGKKPWVGLDTVSALLKT